MADNRRLFALLEPGEDAALITPDVGDSARLLLKSRDCCCEYVAHDDAKPPAPPVSDLGDGIL